MEKSGAANVGKKFGQGIANFLGLGASVATDVTTGLGQGIVDLADMAGDAVSKTTDFVTNAATGGHGTNFDSKEGFLDKFDAHVDKGAKELRDAVHNNTGDWAKSNIGKTIGDAANMGGQILSPVPGVGLIKAMSKIPGIAKATLTTGKVLEKAAISSPKVKAAIESMTHTDDMIKLNDQVHDLIKSGEKVTPDMVAKIAKNISASRDAMKGVKLAPQVETKLSKIASWPADKIVKFGERHPFLKKLFYSLPKNHPIAIAMTAGSIGSLVKNLDSDSVSADVATPIGDQSSQVEFSADDDKLIAEIEKDLSPEGTQANPNKPTGDFDKGQKVDVEKLKSENPNLNVDTSIVDTFKALGINSAMEARKAIYEELTGKPYNGTAEENTILKDKVIDMTPEEIQEKLMNRTLTA